MQIHILALLLVFQSFVACRQESEKVRLSAANVAYQSVNSGQAEPEKSRTTALNIIFQSTDGGQTWQDVSAGLPEDIQVNSVFAGDGEIFVGAQSGLYRGSTIPAVVPVWEEEIFVGETITDIFPGKAGAYAYSYGKGLFQHISGLGIWQPIHIALNDKTVRSVLETADGSVFVSCDNGIYKCGDNGTTWKQVSSKEWVTGLVATADGVLIGSCSSGLVRSADKGEHWEVVLSEPDAYFKTGLIDGNFITTMSGSGAFNSTSRLRTTTDGGKTWQSMYESLPPGGVYDLEKAGEILFCSHDDGIFRSFNNGATWELMFTFKGSMRFNLVVSGQVIYAVPAGGC